MIIYIHGFGGSGQGNKAKTLREIFENQSFIAPSLSYNPTLAIETLKEMISFAQKYEKVYLIGSSLGGYYTTYLADLFDIKAVLLNPSVNPTKTLSKFIDSAKNFYDDSYYEWNTHHIDLLKQYEVKDLKYELYMLLTQTGDELLPYKEGVERFKNSKKIIIEGGNHGFENIEDQIEDIKEFFDMV